MLSNRKSSSLKILSGSECTVAIAPTSLRPIMSGAAITECHKIRLARVYVSYQRAPGLNDRRRILAIDPQGAAVELHSNCGVPYPLHYGSRCRRIGHVVRSVLRRVGFQANHAAKTPRDVAQLAEKRYCNGVGRVVVQPTAIVISGTVAKTSDTRAELVLRTARLSNAISRPNCPMPIRATGSRSRRLILAEGERSAKGSRKASPMA